MASNMIIFFSLLDPTILFFCAKTSHGKQFSSKVTDYVSSLGGK
jgi:hypothetical protein